MAKKLVFSASGTTTSEKQFVSNMRDITFDIQQTGSINTFNDIGMMTPEDTVRQSLINALKLQVGGNVLFPENGSRIFDMIFSNTSDADDLHTALYAFIVANEPRIDIVGLDLSFSMSEFNERIANITLQYKFKTSDEIHQLLISLSK